MSDKPKFTEDEFEVLKAIFDNSMDIIVVKDWEGNFVKCNEIVATLYNTSPEEMVGKEDSFFTGNKEQAEFFRDNVRSIMSEGKRQIVYEESTDAESGEVRSFKSIKTPFKNSKGENQILVVAQDITEVVNREREIQYILNALKVGVWKWDIVNNVLEWSDSNYDVFQVNKEDFSGAFEAWEKTLHPDYQEKVMKELEESLSGDGMFRSTFVIQTPSGEIRYIGGFGDVTFDDDKNPISMIGINWDKTQEIEREKALEEQKLLSQHHAKLASIGELAAGVGHEINNPLAIACGFLNSINEKFKKGELNEENFTNAYEKIKIAHERIQEIVKGLRAFSRAESQTVEDFDFLDVLEESINLVFEIYKKEGIDIVKNYQNIPYKKILAFKGSRGQLQQVFMNLFSNARDALQDSKEKKISLCLDIVDDKLEFFFKDSGHGVAKEIQEKIFDPFFTTKDVNEGTGIGLSIVYSIVQEFGGNISIDSDEKGTTFKIIFPIRILKEEEYQNIVKQDVEAEGFQFETKIKSLVVDDEEGMRVILKEVLSKMNCEVITVENGEEALTLIDKDPEEFDLIISDMKMPKMSGEELLKSLREKYTSLPKIILMTGGVSIDFENDPLLKNHIDGYIYKPFKKADIISVLKKHFK